MKLPLKEAYHNFLKSINIKDLDVKDFDLKEIMRRVKTDYSEVEISGLDLENPESDMLLFEYGNYDWNREGEKFNLSIKRQLFLENRDECGYYGFTIYFDKSLLGKLTNFQNGVNRKIMLIHGYLK